MDTDARRCQVNAVAITGPKAGPIGMVAVAHPGPSRMKIEIVALLPGSSALLYLWLVNRKNLNKNPVTLMNADKTRINAD